MNIPQTIGGNYHSIIKSLQDKPERHVISTYLYLQSISLCHNDNQISFLSFYNFMNLPYELSLRLFKTLQSSKQKQEFISKNDFILGLSAIYSDTDININVCGSSGSDDVDDFDIWKKMSPDDVGAVYDVYPNSGGFLIDEVYADVKKKRKVVQNPVAYILGYAERKRWDDNAEHGEVS